MTNLSQQLRLFASGPSSHPRRRLRRKSVAPLTGANACRGELQSQRMIAEGEKIDLENA
jgi:hypothetical protein